VVIGSGYVGTVVASCLADLGTDVVAIEVDAERLASLRSGVAPFFEPGLDEVLRRAMESGRLRFTDDYDEAFAAATIGFLCVDTPPGPDGHPVMDSVAAAARSIGRTMRRPLILVTKSTVPVGSGEWLKTTIQDAMSEGMDAPDLAIVSNPEFLREGSAVHDFLHPDRIVLGGDSPEALSRIAALYEPVIERAAANGDRRPELVTTTRTSAELIKYAANAFLASKISFINEISVICDAVGAEVTDVARAIGLDDRIGLQFLNAGVGWGGSCFGKDLDALRATALEYGVESHILDAVRTVNAEQRHRVVTKLQQHIRPLRGSRIALLGIAFKPGTDDVRDAPALAIAQQLIRLGARVRAYDPMVKDVALSELVTVADAPTAYEDADAVVIVTEWPEFRDLDLEHMASRMRGGVIIDGRNMLDPDRVEAAGLVYEGFGRPRRNGNGNGGGHHAGW
jgi:UDPglucose 6-dehydrogenase